MKYKYDYKRYMYDIEEYFSYTVEANSIKEAICKIVIEQHGITGKNEYERIENANKFITKKIGNDWQGQEVFDKINPLGTSDTALYRIDRIYQI